MTAYQKAILATLVDGQHSVDNPVYFTLRSQNAILALAGLGLVDWDFQHTLRNGRHGLGISAWATPQALYA